MEYREKSEIRDGMRIDWDMPIKMEDGLVLRCDIYRPIADGKYPVIMTYGPYGKWLLFEDLYKDQWVRMCADQPDVPAHADVVRQPGEHRAADDEICDDGRPAGDHAPGRSQPLRDE